MNYIKNAALNLEFKNFDYNEIKDKMQDPSRTGAKPKQYYYSPDVITRQKSFNRKIITHFDENKPLSGILTPPLPPKRVETNRIESKAKNLSSHNATNQ